MSLRRLFAFVAALIVLSAIWGKRHAIEELFPHANPAPKQIQFCRLLAAG
jgi:disulfide bond formation protein DsbB